jgi:hypothetical protein
VALEIEAGDGCAVAGDGDPAERGVVMINVFHIWTIPPDEGWFKHHH